MTLIDVQELPAAERRALDFISEANREFNVQRRGAYSAVERFWYANGPGELVGSEPSGVEVLQAMGTNAEAFWTAATQRAVMVIGVATALGKLSEIDMTLISGPYDLTFNDDGSLDQATLRT